MHNPNNPIAVARSRAGFTQEQLANAIGVDKRQVSAWECGRFAVRAIVAKRIAAVLNTDWVQLIDVQSNGDYSTIATARKSAGLTQTQLAKAVNVSQSQISNYEHGVSRPSAQTLQRIADVLGIDVKELEAPSDARKRPK